MLPSLLTIVAFAFAGASLPDRPVADVPLTDTEGAFHRLSEWQKRGPVVLVFLGVECPLARLYTSRLNELERRFEARGVQFVGVDSNRHDAPAEIAQFAAEHRLAFPLLFDADGRAARELAAERTPEAFVIDRDGIVRYRGRIDDQYGVGTRRDRAGRDDLATAIEELLAGRPVSVPRTAARGCVIDAGLSAPARDTLACPACESSPARGPDADGNRQSTARPTYWRDAAPILAQHCAGCHQPGQIGPFSLLSFHDALAWAATIREAVAERRMPPWHASPDHGRFRNAPTFSEADRRTLLSWIDAGAVEGEPIGLRPAVVRRPDWSLGPPDQIIGMAEPRSVPAEGIVDYLWFELDPGFTEDRFVKSAEVRPGNRQVVHHCTVFIGPPGRHFRDAGNLLFSDFTPGREPLELPPGMARLVPAGWHIYFSLHYITVGSPQRDQTVLGLRFADPSTVRKEVTTALIRDSNLRIPPHTVDYRTERTLRVPQDWLLLSMFPHMHLRGKSFRYEATFPDGTTEVLLDVPHYDFNWQHQYALTQPKRLPAGTLLRCIGHFDNSAGNPHNPDPGATVVNGDQNSDEMFHGYFDVALADQDRLSLLARLRNVLPSTAQVVLLAAALFLSRRWSRVRKGDVGIRRG